MLQSIILTIGLIIVLTLISFISYQMFSTPLPIKIEQQSKVLERVRIRFRLNPTIDNSIRLTKEENELDRLIDRLGGMPIAEPVYNQQRQSKSST